MEVDMFKQVSNDANYLQFQQTKLKMTAKVERNSENQNPDTYLVCIWFVPGLYLVCIWIRDIRKPDIQIWNPDIQKVWFLCRIKIRMHTGPKSR